MVSKGSKLENHRVCWRGQWCSLAETKSKWLKSKTGKYDWKNEPDLEIGN